MTVLAQTLLAHDGGWDEIAMVAGPLLIFAAVLVLANKRVTTKLNAAAAAVAEAEADQESDADLDSDSDQQG